MSAFWFYLGLVVGATGGLTIFSLLNMAADPDKAARSNNHDG